MCSAFTENNQRVAPYGVLTARHEVHIVKANLVYKLFATYLFLALAAILIIHFHLGGHIKSHLQHKTEESLLTYARILNVASSISEMEKAARQIADTAGTRVTLLDTKGNVIADTESRPQYMENHYDRPEIQEARVRGVGRDTRLSRTLGIETLYISVIIGDESNAAGYIRLARALTDVRESVNALSWALVESFALIGVLSLIIAFIFSQRLVSPIQEMEDFTAKLQKGEFPGTLLISAPDERGRLARNINHLVGELRDKIEWATEEKGKLEAAFGSMADGVFILDGEGIVELCNDSFKRMFPGASGNIIGKTPLDALRNVALQDALDQFTVTREVVSREISIDAGGEQCVMEVTLCPIMGLPRSETKTMVVFHDVTRIKRLEKTRADFVANVTHEIKTPLTAILGYIETLSEGALDNREEALNFLDVIGRHARRLNRLVDDLLVISDLELGELPLSIADISLQSVVESLWSLMDTQASKKGLTISREIPEDLPPLKADRDRLAQILLNLLDNAIKFTDSGGTVSLKAEKSERNTLEVTVSDTGIGISSNHIARLGERFYRVDRARSRHSGGTGLGLSIVKHLVSAHGGEMRIHSRAGRGTEIRLSFPLEKRVTDRTKRRVAG